MNFLYGKMANAARAINLRPATTMDGLRAKTLAAVWCFLPTTSIHRSIEFDDPEAMESLFRACIAMTEVSERARKSKPSCTRN
jgi:hypothetical protein